MTKAEDSVVVRNIYYMMAYAFRVLDIREYAKLKAEEFDNLADLLAAILHIGISLQLKRGLEKDYEETEEEFQAIRGRIDMRTTVRLKIAKRTEVACVYDEFSANTYKNQILKTCALLLMKHPDVASQRKRDLKRCAMALAEVAELNPARIEWGRLRYHRNNGSYQMLMNVCYMVVKGLLQSEDEGKLKLATFKDSQQLHALYEQFVLAYFRIEHPEIDRVSAKIIKRGVGEDAPAFLPGLCTDITLENGTKTLIIDAKCYGNILGTHHDKEMLSPGNLNQIQSYVMHESYDSPGKEVQGMLLYALTEHESAISESWDEIGHRFHVRTLDLGCDFKEIAAQLDDIATLVV